MNWREAMQQDRRLLMRDRIAYDTGMTALAQKRMTVDEFLTWAEGQPGRYELFRGTVYAMTPERAVHAEVKFAVQTALAGGIRARGLPCHMLPDGMTRAPIFSQA